MLLTDFADYTDEIQSHLSEIFASNILILFLL